MCMTLVLGYETCYQAHFRECVELKDGKSVAFMTCITTFKVFVSLTLEFRFPSKRHDGASILSYVTF